MMPKEFMKLINDYHHENLNLMDAADLLMLFKHVRNMAEALEAGLEYEECPTFKDCEIAGHKEMRAALRKFREWK